ncbi:hypothetical protein [Anaerosinus massiliensis]|uniref:hypothetical protein n=1 Tax=Massilibacillus massiliensis TaxID=1806837 RepID=UPI000DA61814|nr:hypothetical protein [Massilibacillus massiliensis]
MTTVGDRLTAPEKGWKRYDDTDTNFTYTGTWTRYDEKTSDIYVAAYNKSLLFATSEFAMVSFNFKGTMLRVIANRYSNKPSDINIYIDDVAYTFSEYGTIQQDFQRVCFEKIDLENKEHSVKISYSNLLSGNWDFDAIDIDETGELLPYNPDIKTNQVLLRITMNDSSEREYKVTHTEVDKFIQWINGAGRAGDNCYKFTDVVDESMEYLIFEKIISFKVLELK